MAGHSANQVAVRQREVAVRALDWTVAAGLRRARRRDSIMLGSACVWLWQGGWCPAFQYEGIATELVCCQNDTDNQVRPDKLWICPSRPPWQLTQHIAQYFQTQAKHELHSLPSIARTLKVSQTQVGFALGKQLASHVSFALSFYLARGTFLSSRKVSCKEDRNHLRLRNRPALQSTAVLDASKM